MYVDLQCLKTLISGQVYRNKKLITVTDDEIHQKIYSLPEQ